MDRADLDEVPEPDNTSHGLNLSPRLNFVPPPEVPTPESASIEARAKALGIDALIGLGALILLSIIFGGISSSNGLFRIKISGPPLLMATVLWLGYMTWMEAKHGASIGKRARGLRVVMEDGEPVTPEAALTRNLMRFLDASSLRRPLCRRRLRRLEFTEDAAIRRPGRRDHGRGLLAGGHRSRRTPAASPTSSDRATWRCPRHAVSAAGGGGRDAARGRRGRCCGLPPDAGGGLGAPSARGGIERDRLTTYLDPSAGR